MTVPRVLAVVLVLMPLVPRVASAVDTTLQPPVDCPSGKLLVFGDSLTGPAFNFWPEMLCMPSIGYGGTTTENWADPSTYPNPSIVTLPDLTGMKVFFILRTNDALMAEPGEEWIDEFDLLMFTVASRSPEHVYVIAPPEPSYGPYAYVLPLLFEYRMLMDPWCSVNGVSCIDDLYAYDFSGQYMDGLHWDKSGNMKVIQLLSPWVVEALSPIVVPEPRLGVMLIAGLGWLRVIGLFRVGRVRHAEEHPRRSRVASVRLTSRVGAVGR